LPLSTSRDESALMRQILQSLTDGRTSLVDVPAPGAPTGGLLVRSTCSLISSGTERMLVDFSRAGWLEKTRQQPDKVRQVIEKVRTDGLLPAVEAVRSRLEQPLPLGYCNVGIVAAVGAEVRGFARGDRVVSNGPHAEWVAVPRNMCARIPPGVADDEAVFAIPGAIALQGVRLAAPTLGESFVVTGLGLIGLLTVQLLRANGCRVLGVDPDPRKGALARGFGADVVAMERGEEVLAVAESFSHGRGVDGVLITAATTSNEPIAQAARMCRKRGRIVLVGVAGLTLERADFYEKELSFQVSCSYGPGRYDPEYEEQGKDYPAGFVRWTAQRNFEAILEMLCTRQLDVRPLISHRFAFDAAPEAYELLVTAAEPYSAIVLEYASQGSSAEPLPVHTVVLGNASQTAPGSAPAIGFVGAGNYAARVLLPAFAASGARLRAVASNRGVSAAHCARRFGIDRATTDSAALIAAADVDAVVIATRHDSHAAYIVQALQAGKHVFVEKPLAITAQQIDAVVAAWEGSRSGAPRPQLLVGFNRRFAPQAQRMQALLGGLRAPKTLIATVNAGAVPAAHWTQDPRIGGGRIVGEACHFVDLLRYLVGQPIVDAEVATLGASGSPQADNVVISLKFADGSLGTIHYLTGGHRAFPKERIEAFCAGHVLQLDNFRRLRGWGFAGFRALNLWRQDKGQRALVQNFVNAIRAGGEPPIPFAELIEVSRIVVALGEAARS
jgi:predicted dehydrogenase/threonine dehydrogenase-like Zn-dependent dehydrogenase